MVVAKRQKKGKAAKMETKEIHRWGVRTGETNMPLSGQPNLHWVRVTGEGDNG